MTKKLSWIGVGIVLVGALILGGCVKPAAPASEEIRVGANEAATGVLSGFANGAIFGVKAAVDDINKLGGVYVKEYGRKLTVKLILVDNESDSSKSGALARDLVLRDKIHVLTAVSNASMCNPMSSAVEQYKIPFLAGEGPMEPWEGARMSASPPWQYTWGNGFAIGTPAPAGDFRAGKTGYSIADTWLEFMDMFGGQTNKKVAVMASDDPDGRGWYAGFPPILKDKGYTLIGIEKGLGSIPIGTTDFSSTIAEWKNNDCEVLWANAIAPDFGTLLKQGHTMGWVPKIIMAARAALFLEDISAWGGDIPLGVGSERWWFPDAPPKLFPGIGDTTPKTLLDRWVKETGKPLNPAMGFGYFSVQILADAIERAGTLEGEKLNKAIGETDMLTIMGRAAYTKEEQHNRVPLAFGQWVKTDKPGGWECPIVISRHDFIPTQAKPMFPVPATTFK